MVTQRNSTLELLKLFASYMVVFIHVAFYGDAGTIMDALARFAVPLFFVISGFFSYKTSTEKIKKRIKHIAILFVCSTILYTFFNIGSFLWRGNAAGIISYFGNYLDLKTLINLFVFNAPVSKVHLWYLLAILYVYAIFYFVTVLHISEKIVFPISFSLLALHILLGEGLSAFGIALPALIVRNFALLGIPFFALGLFTKKHEDKLRNTPNSVIILAAVIGILETILSRYLLGQNELYIGSVFILFAVVAVFMKYPSVKYPHIFDTLTGCSTYIYVFHMMVSSVIQKFYPLFHLDYTSSVLLKNIHPILVCIASTILAYCIMQISKLILSKHKKSTD